MKLVKHLWFDWASDELICRWRLILNEFRCGVATACCLTPQPYSLHCEVGSLRGNLGWDQGPACVCLPGFCLGLNSVIFSEIRQSFSCVLYPDANRPEEGRHLHVEIWKRELQTRHWLQNCLELVHLFIQKSKVNFRSVSQVSWPDLQCKTSDANNIREAYSGSCRFWGPWPWHLSNQPLMLKLQPDRICL